MALARTGAEIATGLRPFNPFRDLRGVASLLVRVFGSEMRLDPGGHSRSLAMAIRSPAFAWLWLGFDAWFDTSLYGFVWEEQGRIIANASIAPLPDSSRQWVLSNVAVEPEYRGRGIATGLVSAAVDYATNNGCARLLLQVWQSNAVAVRMYERLGFRTVGSICRLRLAAGARPAVGLPCPAGVAWRRAQARDRHELVGVANAMAWHDVQSLRRVGTRAFDDDDLFAPLLEALRLARPRPRLAIARGARVVGGVALASTGDPARVVVLLRPDEQEQLGACLAHEAMLLDYGARAALCDVPGGMVVLIEALQGAGAERTDDLLHMTLEPTRVA